MSPSSSKVQLRVSNHHAYVWDVDDIRKLRSEHHICGILAGTLPHLAQQNVFLGVPLLLMPEEVVLLVEKGLAVLIDDCKAHKVPVQAERDDWNSKRRHDEVRSSAQREGAKENSASVKGNSEEALKRRRERQERRAAESTQTSLLVDNLSSIVPQRPPTPASASMSTVTYSVVIPTSSVPLSWYHPVDHGYQSIAEAKEVGLWSYPSTHEERARCAVFQYLWEKGYYMGCGIKFGGEFLVYPGDPLRYHSHFTASVITSPNTTIRPMEFVAHGRLGTATKKAHLLCTWSEDTQEVEVYSLEWSGLG